MDRTCANSDGNDDEEKEDDDDDDDDFRTRNQIEIHMPSTFVRWLDIFFRSSNRTSYWMRLV